MGDLHKSSETELHQHFLELVLQQWRPRWMLSRFCFFLLFQRQEGSRNCLCQVFVEFLLYSAYLSQTFCFWVLLDLNNFAELVHGFGKLLQDKNQQAEMLLNPETRLVVASPIPFITASVDAFIVSVNFFTEVSNISWLFSLFLSRTLERIFSSDFDISQHPSKINRNQLMIQNMNKCVRVASVVFENKINVNIQLIYLLHALIILSPVSLKYPT